MSAFAKDKFLMFLRLDVVVYALGDCGLDTSFEIPTTPRTLGPWLEFVVLHFVMVGNRAH
jgi:hypothetical protein